MRVRAVGRPHTKDRFVLRSVFIQRAVFLFVFIVGSIALITDLPFGI